MARRIIGLLITFTLSILVAKSLYVTSAFMGLSPGGRMNPGRDHKAEKSVHLVSRWREIGIAHTPQR
jgi:hypothetical protein